MKTYIATVTDAEDGSGDVIIPLDPSMVSSLGWKPGDTVIWKDNNDGTFSITKKEIMTKKLLMVESVSMFRMRYLVEVDEGDEELTSAELDNMLEGLKADECEELGQKHIGQQLMSTRIVSHDEALALALEDNPYTNSGMVNRLIIKK